MNDELNKYFFKLEQMTVWDFKLKRRWVLSVDYYANECFLIHQSFISKKRSKVMKKLYDFCINEHLPIDKINFKENGHNKRRTE